MFLEKVLIKTQSEIIREVNFKRGVNLITDITSTDAKESGNNVGKSTFLKVIDFCFGSDGKRIYEDSEFKTINEDVYNFLTQKDVLFELYLEADGEKHCFKRDFKDLFQIDDKNFSNIDDYCRRIKELCFNSTLQKPTLRQLLNKFIRIEDYQVSNTLRCAHPSTDGAVYELMYLFLFGFDNQELLMDLYELNNDIGSLKDKKSALLKEDSLGSLRQALAVIKKEIDIAEERKKGFEVEQIYEDSLNTLGEIKKEISNLSVDISNQEMRLSLNNNSVQELKNSFSKINLETIAKIYEEAKIYLPTINKTLEQVKEFYNKMIYKRVEFIEKEINKLQPQIKDKRILLKKYLDKEKKIFNSISDKGKFSDLQKLHDELYRLYEKKGQKESLMQIIEETNEKLKTKIKMEEELEERMSVYLEDLNQKIEIFNEFFSDYAKKLYDEKYVLGYDFDDAGTAKRKKFGFKIDSVEKNVGPGKKKGQITAFDLAYISFLNKIQSKGLRFILHDKNELMHLHQIKTSFDIASEIDGQYVVAILRDRIVSELGNQFIQDNAILELSQKDKLFKIESQS